MIREERKTVYCTALGKQVMVVEYYQVEGTRTCQVEVTPFFWQCSEEKICLSPICKERAKEE